MVEDKASRFSMYMSLFGLRGRFTSEELRHAYRTLAKLNHPDVNKQDTSSKMRMIIINEGYRFISEILENGELDKFITERNDTEKNDDVDRAYSQYRRGFSILTEAFDRYYGDQKTPDEGDIHVLRE
ncbi:MAG: DnaJ domain-containing protein, partial [Spirochaetota bacterium]